MWHYIPESDRYHASLAQNKNPAEYDDSDIVFKDSAKPTHSQALLFADALNVHEATGLTPSQLQARVVELEAALREALPVIVPDDLHAGCKAALA
ncbi:MAG: hypothetical protein RSE94_11655 [Pseudomonas sp.]